MKALVWVAKNEMKIEDVPKPEPPAGWVLVRVFMSGVCGSEVAAYLGLNELRVPPLTMGHEFSGVVEKIGAGSPEHLKERLVAVNPMVTCGHCMYCLTGLRNLCHERKIIGAAFPGSFAEYVAVPASSCYPVENPAAGAISEPLATALRAVDKCNLRTGDSAVVFGMGIIGLLILKLLRRRGVNDCTAVDVNEERLKTARIMGATRVVNGRDSNTLLSLRSAAGQGADFSFDAVGVESTREQCVSVIRRGGKAIFIGNHEATSRIGANSIVRGELVIEGSYAYTDAEFSKAVTLAGTDFLDDRQKWITMEPLDNGPVVFSKLASNLIGSSKVMLTL
ncbi:MAG: alcohol dehydrogenase catalytic domain-containing protein [Thermoplasmata archaeon]|nr:alcohol dehydrogenase catalytic domain-containing protein [Candidatus Sysuiplasma acidicola]MBX8646167.1 alcohol dehydrogenase catalytic domain-containing protein [Candidatus Sysuiplasma acidicola]